MSSVDDSRGRSSSEADEEPEAKKPRKLTGADLGGPIENEKTAKAKLINAGFDPENLMAEWRVVTPPDGMGQWGANAITQFCGAGDLKMVRYLVSKGMSTTSKAAAGDRISPMRAALFMGQTHVCRWLFQHGAAFEVKTTSSLTNEANLLRTSLRAWKAGRGSNASQWLVQNGALALQDGSPDFDAIDRIASYSGATSEFRNLLLWAEESLRVNTNTHLILLGTILPREYSTDALLEYLSHGLKSEEAAKYTVGRFSPEERLEFWKKLPFNRSSPLQALAGQPGILEVIADFAGFVRGKHMLRILQSMVRPLESAIAKSRVIMEYDDVDSDDDGTVAGSEVSFIGDPH